MTYLYFKVKKKWNFITDLHINLLLCCLQSCTECGTSNPMATLLPVTATSKDKNNNFQTHSGSLRLDCPDAQLWLVTEMPWMSDSSLTASCLCRSLWRLRLEERCPTSLRWPPPQKLNFTPLTSEGKQETLQRIPESVTSGFFHGTKTLTSLLDAADVNSFCSGDKRRLCREQQVHT